MNEVYLKLIVMRSIEHKTTIMPTFIFNEQVAFKKSSIYKYSTN
jgi:hypothetical protein